MCIKFIFVKQKSKFASLYSSLGLSVDDSTLMLVDLIIIRSINENLVNQSINWSSSDRLAQLVVINPNNHVTYSSRLVCHFVQFE